MVFARKTESSTASKPLVAHLSSPSADRTQIYNSKAQNPGKSAFSGVFLYPFRLIAFEAFRCFWPYVTSVNPFYKG